MGPNEAEWGVQSRVGAGSTAALAEAMNKLQEMSLGAIMARQQLFTLDLMSRCCVIVVVVVVN